MDFTSEEQKMLVNCIFFTRTHLLNEFLEEVDEDVKKRMEYVLKQLDELEAKIANQQRKSKEKQNDV